MAEKDITEKLLEAYNDVFADIVNVLIFNGENVVKEDELVDILSRSQYKAGKKIREQERDVAKQWTRSFFTLAILGLENQTGVDNDIAFRVIGYDGASYRNQLKRRKKRKSDAAGDAPDERYPVLTLVLYFGKSPWTGPRSLYESMDILPALKPFINDYKANIFDIPRLPRETIDKFKSDFWYVADYFWQVQNSEDYIPSPKQIEHVTEVLQLLSVLTKDYRFEEAAEQAEKGEQKAMSEVLDRAEARGEARGIVKGKSIGKITGAADMAKDFGFGREQTIEKIMRKFLLDRKTAEEYVNPVFA